MYERVKQAIDPTWRRCASCSMWMDYEPTGVCYVQLQPGPDDAWGHLPKVRADETCPEWQQLEIG
jgi:hypothetical protein